ncbi:MAG: hypothetical protein U1C47_13990 [Hydrogenophaga sp.]|nr:hypothetical protein [Hydrogenophaga sp.]
MAATYFFRYEIKSRRECLEDQQSSAVVIVDRDERRARDRLVQMHPWAWVISVQQTPFELPAGPALGSGGARLKLSR